MIEESPNFSLRSGMELMRQRQGREPAPCKGDFIKFYSLIYNIIFFRVSPKRKKNKRVRKKKDGLKKVRKLRKRGRQKRQRIQTNCKMNKKKKIRKRGR